MERVAFFHDASPQTPTTQSSSKTGSNAPVESANERKRRHKLTEQRGRQKINSQITELKDLLPECKYVITTKASVLECAINSLKRLQSVCNQLVTTNKKLQTENAYLRQELERATTSRSFQATTESQDPFAINNFADPTLYTAPQDDAYGFFDGIPQANTLDLSNSFAEPSKEHSPNSSPTTTSDSSGGNSPHNYLPQHLVREDDEEEDPLSAVVKAQGYKVSRQKLFLVFLFLVPFCFSLENLNLPLMGSTVSSTARSLMSSSAFSGFISPPTLTLGFFLEVIRLLFYVFWGIMGFTWIANTIKWFFKLESKDTISPPTNGQFFATYSRVTL